MAKRVTGIIFVLMLFAFLRVVPAQQPAPNAPGRGAQPGAPGQPGANPPGRGAQAPRESRVVRLDPAFDAIVPPGALIERVAGGFGFAEGPVWTSQGSLLFSDIPGNTIVRLMPNGEFTPFRRPIYYGTAFRPGFHIGSNGLTLDKEGRVIIAEHGNRRVARLEVTGEMTVLGRQHEGKRLNSPNDAAVKSDGAVFHRPAVRAATAERRSCQRDSLQRHLPCEKRKGRSRQQGCAVAERSRLHARRKHLIVANSDPMRRV